MTQAPPPPAIVQAPEAAPIWAGDPDAALRLGAWLEGARRSTEAFGPWPAGSWKVYLHDHEATFERLTQAPPGRAALWVGDTLHLRPWDRLKRRDLGSLFRHELTHRRAAGQGLPRWKEEALCLWAEGHTTLPPWPEPPSAEEQRRLDTALAAGTTASQRWAYQWLRAWLGMGSRPAPSAKRPSPAMWSSEDDFPPVRVVWPPERLPRTLEINGQAFAWRAGARFRFEGGVRFAGEVPLLGVHGSVELEGTAQGWRLTWALAPERWVAAAAEGELGRDAPLEAKRALAAVLWRWLEAHSQGNHPDGSLCPLTHCAVVRGEATAEGMRAAASAPALDIPPDRACFTGSNGGAPLSPREVWGSGSLLRGSGQAVPGDPWASWTRRLTAAQVQVLKSAVRPGLKPGQRGVFLGVSGPYAVESLRLEAGRRFGWTTWPSNACETEALPGGQVGLRGRGWGHNVGLCLATALHRARAGDEAEAILAAAFETDAP